MEKKSQTGFVDILILFFNKVDQTILCINSFLPSGQNIYVLNNGSDEQQLKKLQQTFAGNSQVRIFDAGKNLGVSGGRNFLINNTTAPWLLSVDNDITIQPSDWLTIFCNYLEANPRVQIVAPHIYNVHEQMYSEQLKVTLAHKKVMVETGSFPVTNCFPGGASIIKRTVFEQYGLFDEEMFVGFEDYEYALRALLSVKGPFEVHHLNAVELIHDHQYQKSSKDKEAVRQRYNEERLTASYERMVQKFGVEFDHNWQWWTRNQVTVMTEKPWLSRLKRILVRLMKS
ncbi:MAG: glycosyltransferase family 2 protein [Lacibacter sp.]